MYYIKRHYSSMSLQKKQPVNWTVKTDLHLLIIIAQDEGNIMLGK